MGGEGGKEKRRETRRGREEEEEGEAHVSHKEKITYECYQSHHLLLLLPSSLPSSLSFVPLSLRPHLAASMPSQVELSLISTRSLLMLACSYSSMNRRAFAIEASLSKDSLGRGGGGRESGVGGGGRESGVGGVGRESGVGGVGKRERRRRSGKERTEEEEEGEERAEEEEWGESK